MSTGLLSGDRKVIDDLLVQTFNSILKIERDMLTAPVIDGLTMNDIHILSAVDDSGVRMGELARRMHVTVATMTTSVTKLVDQGLLMRGRSDFDRRVVLVTPTSRAKAVARLHRIFHENLVNQAVDQLTDEEERVLIGALTKVKSFFEDFQEHQLVPLEDEVKA